MITTNELTGETCHIGYYPGNLSADFIQKAHRYCKTTPQYKGGLSGWGKPIPRLQNWFQEDGIAFSHKWKTDFDRWKADEYDMELSAIQEEIREKVLELGFSGISPFNSCLINYYRNGQDSIKPHFDSMDLFGPAPFICIFSLGAPREIVFKRRCFNPDNPKSLRLDPLAKHLGCAFRLEEGSLLIMSGATQKYYQHEIVKEDMGEERWSMTFRHFLVN